MDKTQPKFGVAGFPVNFFDYSKNRNLVFEWLASLGLTAMEYQCTHGVRTKEERAIELAGLANTYGIELSVHAPYFACLASSNPGVVERSIERLKKAMVLVKQFGGTKVIFHPGYFQKQDRQAALHKLISNLNIVKDQAPVEDVYLYPEIGGGVKSLGSLDEIISMCEGCDIARPCIDWAHLHARNMGSLKTTNDFTEVLSKLVTRLGIAIVERLHCHFSVVEYSAAGERRHKGFGEPGYGPDYKMFIDAVIHIGITPSVISEYKNTQEVGAVAMQDYYNQVVKVVDEQTQV